MNIDRARELLQVQTSLGSGYNRNSARLIRELDFEQAFGFKPGHGVQGGLTGELRLDADQGPHQPHNHNA